MAKKQELGQEEKLVADPLEQEVADHRSHPNLDNSGPEQVVEITSLIEQLLAHGNTLTTYIAERVQYSSYATAVDDANFVVEVLRRAKDKA